MEAKEILKVHVAKLASLTDDQFDYFFSFLKNSILKRDRPSSAKAMQSAVNIL